MGSFSFLRKKSYCAAATHCWTVADRQDFIWTVLSLCCYGKVLDFMIKNTRFTKQH